MKGKIFNAQEVQAILNESKIMFREVIKNQPCVELGNGTIERNPITDSIFYWKGNNNYSMFSFGKCPYQVGETIFVKEAFNIFCGQVAYKTTITGNERYFWLPANRMKQEHSRLTLRIKSVKVERLQDISEEDAVNEGFKAEHWLINTPDCYEYDGITAVQDFAGWWDETHKKPEEKFEANPWVFVYEYEVIKK